MSQSITTRVYRQDYPHLYRELTTSHLRRVNPAVAQRIEDGERLRGIFRQCELNDAGRTFASIIGLTMALIAVTALAIAFVRIH